MARPKVFISSTFFDLRQIREDIERFVLELGYDPVRHETGAIPYAKENALEISAYQEVEQSDIIINIIGGRFGTVSKDGSGRSITQNELLEALERGIQVFVFVEHNVLSELNTYRLNKDNKEIRYGAVDDPRVYEHLESLYQLPSNNPITGFQTAKDITDFLRAQWAGLFRRFLRQQTRISEIRVLDEMKSITGTLHQLVNFLTIERENRDEAIKSILLANHPAFRTFKKIVDAPYRVFFTTFTELDAWLKARGWLTVQEEAWDEDSVHEWSKKQEYIKLTHDIFDQDQNLKQFTENTWKDEWVLRKIIPETSQDPAP